MDSRLDQTLTNLKHRLQNRADELRRVMTLIPPTKQKAERVQSELDQVQSVFERDRKKLDGEIATLKKNLDKSQSLLQQLQSDANAKISVLKSNVEAQEREVTRLELEKETIERDIEDTKAQLRRAEAEIKKTLTKK